MTRDARDPVLAALEDAEGGVYARGGNGTRSPLPVMPTPSETAGDVHVVQDALSGPTWSYARRYNALRRDFTVNSLLLDPFSRVIYDYCGGVADCRSRVLRTVAPPEASFTADPARHAALHSARSAHGALHIYGATSDALQAMGPGITGLSQGRLQMRWRRCWCMGRGSCTGIAVEVWAAGAGAASSQRLPAGRCEISLEWGVCDVV